MPLTEEEKNIIQGYYSILPLAEKRAVLNAVLPDEDSRLGACGMAEFTRTFVAALPLLAEQGNQGIKDAIAENLVGRNGNRPPKGSISTKASNLKSLLTTRHELAVLRTIATPRPRVSQETCDRAGELLEFIRTLLKHTFVEMPKAKPFLTSNLGSTTTPQATLIPTPKALLNLGTRLAPLGRELSAINHRFKEELAPFADGKKLKGNEIVAWLGEIYGKILLNGKLVGEDAEHDFETEEGFRVSVKTRRGSAASANRSSAIPKIEGEGTPTHLMFVRLNDDFSLDRIWLFHWETLRNEGRFTPHIVRKAHRSFVFNLKENDDRRFLIYSGE